MKRISLVMLITCMAACAKKEVKQDKLTVNSVLATLPADTTWASVPDPDMSDEFDGTTLDTTKLNPAPLWYYEGLTGLFGFKAANTTVSGGYAHISAKAELYVSPRDSVRHFTAGCLKSKFMMGGDIYLEVRAKMLPGAANVCAAIWLGDEPTVAKNPNIEIDMQESKDPINHPDYVTTSILKWPTPYNSAHPNDVYLTGNHQMPEALDMDFHTYGLERRNGMLRFFLDDSNYVSWPVIDSVPEFVTQLRPLILSIEGIAAGMPDSTKLPADFLIDYVHVYHAQ